MLKAPDSIQAIPELQRTFCIFSSICRKAEHVEQRGVINSHRITLNNLSNGVYHYEIQFASKQKSVGKITILN